MQLELGILRLDNVFGRILAEPFRLARARMLQETSASPLAFDIAPAATSLVTQIGLGN